jgi:acetyltransferase-like isoleucine patch superfamily enzyme
VTPRVPVESQIIPTGIGLGMTRRHDVVGAGIRRAWSTIARWGAIGPESADGRRFGTFGSGSIVCFPVNTIFNERYIYIGCNTMIGPHVTLSAGMVPDQKCLSDPVVRIGDRCLIGKGSGIVGHFSIDIGNDVWTGHHVYITDQNHGYEDVDRPISAQTMPERPVSIGDGSWIGHGTVVLPGAQIGRHVTVGANSVVTGVLPDFCVAVGNPARVIRRYDADAGWVRSA